MIMQRQSDGTYTQIGFIKTPTDDIDKIVDKNGDIYFTKGFTRQVSGYPATLSDSIGKPLLDYKIYGNIVQNSGTVTENKKLKDSSNKVIIDSEGNEIRTNEIVTYNSPSPDAPAEVKGVGNKTDNGYEIPVVSRGKNLFDFKTVYSDTSKFTINGDSVSGMPTSFSIINIKLSDLGLSIGDTFCFSVTMQNQANGKGIVATTINGRTLDGNYDITESSYVSKIVATVETVDDVVRITFSYGGTITASNIQLEFGSTATEYEPYREPITTPICLPEPLYKDDYIAKDKSGGKVHRAWGVKVFDGTEYWRMDYNLDFYYITLKCKHIPHAYCSHFAFSVDGGVINVSGVLRFHCVSIFPTLDDFKSFLASEYSKGTPVTVYYPLAEPTEESIELPDLPTFDDTTIIETDTEIPSSNIEVSYKSKKLS